MSWMPFAKSVLLLVIVATASPNIRATVTPKPC